MITRRIPFIGLVLLAMLAGCSSDRQVISNATDAHKSLEPAVIEDEVLVNYIQQIGDRVIEEAASMSAAGKGPKRHFEDENNWMFSDSMRFHFVNSKTMNAFTTGGEHMYIYTQLFLECKNEDELAAVIAHEYAHIYGRHVQKGMDRQLGALLIAGAGGVAGAAVAGEDNRLAGAAAGAGVGFAGASFVNMGFTRDDESEADKYGFRFYTRAGWDPEKFHGFFQTMVDKGLDTTPEIVSDHPSLKNRVKTIKQWTAELPPEAAEWRRDNVASAKRFKELQDRARKLGRDLPNDTTLSGETLRALPRSCISPIPQFEDQKKAQETLMKRSESAQQSQ